MSIASETTNSSTAKPIDPRHNLVGLARMMAVTDPNIPVHDLYDEVGSQLYDTLGWYGYDTATPVQLARRTGGPVLDLACGSGRIGLAVAQRGLPVTGVDLSADMLARYAARLADEPPEVAAATRLVQADVHAFDLDRRFALAVLGATTIVLINPARRRQFFSTVHHHLEQDAVFAMDFFRLDMEELRRSPNRQSVIDLPLMAEGTGYAVSCQRFDLGARREQVSFVVEQIFGPGRSDRYLVTTAKAILCREEIETDLVASGFDLVAETERRHLAPLDTGFDWLLARAR